jgi:hypothetical protein
MNMNFWKIAKQFVIAALLIVILGGAAIGAAYRTQIQEAITYHQTYAEGNDSKMQEEQGQNVKEKYFEKENVRARNHEFEHIDFFDSVQITEPSTTAKILLGVYGLLCLLIGVSYWLIIAAWLYQAAEKSSMNGFLWALLGIFFNFAAVLAFVLMRSRKAVCPGCGRRQDAAEYCRFCGVAMRHKCGACGVAADIRDTYCSQCGKSLKNDAPSEKK